MKSKLTVVSIFLSTQVFSQASDSLLKNYDKQFIYRYGSNFMKGGNKLSFDALASEFNSRSLSLDLYRKSKKNRTVSVVLRLASTVVILGVVKSARDNNSSLTYGLIAGQLVTGLGSIYFNNKSITDLDRALHIRNREVLFGSR